MSRMRMQKQGKVVVVQNKLPQPCGYKILCGLQEIAEVSSGGIVLTTKTVTEERTASQVLEVLAMGPQAYTDKTRYAEPWCKVGDHVLVRPFAGVRVMVCDKEFRIIDEDMIEAVLPDSSVVTSL